jgi:uncharacterized membrane protein YhaH (DUF805 family)
MMGLGWLYFSLTGRIGRQQFWRGALLQIGITLPFYFLWLINPQGWTFGLYAVIGLLVAWPEFAFSVKRWHDRDRSGWWTLIAVFPVIGWLWVVVETWLLKGTAGPNQYGSDPT